MKNIAVLFVLALSLVATCPQAQEAGAAVAVTGSDALVKKKGRFKETWVRPDADLARYGKLYLQVVELQFREKGVKPVENTTMSDQESEVGLSEAEQERYRQVATEALADELKRGAKLEMVHEAGPDTLLVRASILDIVCNVPPTFVDRREVYPSVVGKGTLRFELIDAETGVIQARLEERSRVLPPSRIASDVSQMPVYRETMWRDIERWSRNGASELRRVLDEAQESHGPK
jgi:hypothetical protein